MKVFGKLRQRVKDRRAASRERYAEKHASSTKDMGGPRMHGHDLAPEMIEKQSSQRG
jgi:hypothetical protein